MSGTRVAPRRVSLLVVMAGATGTGKTTVAEFLARRMPGVRHVESDVVRKRLAGVFPTARVASNRLLDGIYSPTSTRAAYEEMYRQAEWALADGRSVILDGTFRQKASRAAATVLGRRTFARTVILECRVDPVAQVERLQARYQSPSAASDGRPELLRLHQNDWEPVKDEEADLVLRIDTSGPLHRLGELVADCALRDAAAD